MRQQENLNWICFDILTTNLGLLHFFPAEVFCSHIFFTPVKIFGGKKGSNFFAIILEKLFKTCLNINVHLRHIGYLELNLYLKLSMISGFRSLHQ